MTKPPVAAARPPAIPLPQAFEPHALEPAAGSGAQSRYPAKKAKRARSTRAAEPVATPALHANEAVAAPPPVLLLGYSPASPPAETDLPSSTGSTPTPFNLDAWADEVLDALRARPVFDTPSPAMMRAAAAPLPRRTTVTVWRKNGPLDAIARWVRTHAWRLAVKIAPKSPPKATEVDRLRAENEALRRQLMALQQVPA